MVPIEIRLLKNRRTLVVTWENGQATPFSAPFLRDRSRAAHQIRAAIDGNLSAASPDVELVDVRPIGDHAVQLCFSDGHDRGIYPWPYLRELASEPGSSPGALA
jgi:DUF971 family protein